MRLKRSKNESETAKSRAFFRPKICQKRPTPRDPYTNATNDCRFLHLGVQEMGFKHLRPRHAAMAAKGRRFSPPARVADSRTPFRRRGSLLRTRAPVTRRPAHECNEWLSFPSSASVGERFQAPSPTPRCYGREGASVFPIRGGRGFASSEVRSGVRSGHSK